MTLLFVPMPLMNSLFKFRVASYETVRQWGVELAGDSYTTDPDQMDCMECEALLGRPQDAATVAVAYDQGYADGKEKAYFEL